MKYKLLPFTLLFIFVLFAQKNNLENQREIHFNSKTTSYKQALLQFSKMYDLNENYSFKSIYSNVDRKGQMHQKYQQYYKGIKVEYGTAITHAMEGYVRMINGELYNVAELSLVPKISSSKGLQLALQKINASSYLWENQVDAKLMDYEKPSGELLIFPNIHNGQVYLAYKYDIYATKPISRQEIYVDANTGIILFSNQIIKHATSLVTNEEHLERKITFSSGTADTRYSGTKNIETTFDTNNSNYTLRDQTRGSGIFTFNCENLNAFQNVDFTDNDNNWSSLEYDNPAKDNGALDAHWGAETTYDFWLNIFGRNSFDDNGGAIRNYVHFGTNYNNAGWNGFAMTYGDGTSFDILTSIDVCGHEIGHAVCTYTADLVYQNESGAMNEGFSDIWGACIEHYGRTGGLLNPIPSSVWLIGEDISNSALRSMENPNSTNDPDTYFGTNWYSGTADSGGVHTNSGVLNHWFYILTVGKSGTNNAPSPDTFSITGIGMQKSSEIAYLAERDYLTPNSTYADARKATIAVVSDLYCANSPEAIAVTNAWFAVNVGDEFVSVADDVAIQAINHSEIISCSASSVTTNVLIKNQGLNPISTISISYTVDGINPVNTTWNGNLDTCSEIIYPITINGLTRGAHNLSVTSTIINDGRSENNTKEITLLINNQGTVGEVNEFTNATDELISYNEGDLGSLWTRGIHTDNPANNMDSNGNIVYATNLSGNYSDDIKSYLISQCYNLSSISNPEINFSMKYDLENNWDVIYVEYSTDFGANWNVLGSMTANWYNSNRTQQTTGNDCFNCRGAQWTGTDTTNKTYSYPLASLNTETNIIFRIVFHSDQAANQLGVNIDNFVISGTLANESFNQNLVAVYPNPSTGIYTISLANVQPTSIEVYDVTGKIILSKKNILVNDNKAIIDLTDASKGIYFLTINSNSGIISKRIVKE